MANDPGMSIRLAESALINAGKLLSRWVNRRSSYAAFLRVDVPALKTTGDTVGAVRSVREHAFVGTAVDGHAAVCILEAIGDMKYIAGIDVTPDNFLNRSPARQ